MWCTVFCETLPAVHVNVYTPIEDKYVALESAFYPGQHLGILEDGELKPPPETPALDRASLFIPFPHATVSAHAVQHAE